MCIKLLSFSREAAHHQGGRAARGVVDLPLLDLFRDKRNEIPAEIRIYERDGWEAQHFLNREAWRRTQQCLAWSIAYDVANGDQPDPLEVRQWQAIEDHLNTLRRSS